MPAFPTLWRQRQEDKEFKIILLHRELKVRLG